MPIVLVLAAMVQDPPAVPPAERFSILAGPCQPGATQKQDDVVVCGRSLADEMKVPPELRAVPNHPVPMNPDMKASVALDGPAAEGCGPYGYDCPVALGGYILPKLVSGAADLAKGVFAKHPDKTGRVPIDLGAPPPPGRLLP